MQRIRAALVAGAILTAVLPVLPARAITVPEGCIGSVTTNASTAFYYEHTGGFSALWQDAAAASEATVVLYADWTGEDGALGSGRGFTDSGALVIPAGHEVTIDLYGNTLDRGLKDPIADGEVILVEEGATLNLGDTNSELGYSGAVSGGHSLDTAGGIQVEAGATVNLWGGSVSRNLTYVNGGGIMMAGEGSTLNITGGSIHDNHAMLDGGAVGMAAGSIKIVGGDITGNSAESGGGIYAQAGSIDLQGGTVSENSALYGGGILINGTAELSFKGTPVLQRNIASGEEAAGAGILALSQTPIRLSGTPTILNNVTSSGDASNLVLQADPAVKNTVFTHLTDTGLQKEAKIGLSLYGKGRHVPFTESWTGPDCFISDRQNYEIRTEGDVLVLHCTSSILEDINMTLVWIVLCAVLLLIAVIGIIVFLVRSRRDRRQERPDEDDEYEDEEDEEEEDEEDNEAYEEDEPEASGEPSEEEVAPWQEEAAEDAPAPEEETE
ncbi:MAG: hypothetical protein IJ055_00880 [Oscillospiraceae bacterium]|nr:hypothetical protein [Oscillospiraceae bacterium]